MNKQEILNHINNLIQELNELKEKINGNSTQFGGNSKFTINEAPTLTPFSVSTVEIPTEAWNRLKPKINEQVVGKESDEDYNKLRNQEMMGGGHNLLEKYYDKSH